MRLRHVPAESPEDREDLLATKVEVANSLRSQLRGLTFRKKLPEDFAMVFEFGRIGVRTIHMLFVPVPLDVLWLQGDEVVKCKTLSPWTGFGRCQADRVIEFPNGATQRVGVGDIVRLESDE